MEPYELIRSRRKTLALEITRDCRVVVRAPLRASRSQIDTFVRSHEDWITKHLETQRRRQAAEDAEAARQQALREVQADCDALRQRAGAKMPQAVDTILRRVVQE